MRLLVTTFAILLATSSSFAQMQNPTTPPRLVKQNKAKRGTAQKTTVKRKAVQRRVVRPAAKPVVKRAAPAPAPAPAPVLPIAEQKKPSLMETHFQIRLFTEVIGPNLTNSNGDWAYPDVNKNGNYVAGDDPVSAWNQLSFRWKVSDAYHAFINPRFSTHFASTKRIRAANRSAAAGGSKTSDDGMFRNEDWLLGFQGVAWKSESTGWSLFIRPGYRLPTSRFTRNNNWGGEAELLYTMDWAGASNWGFGYWHMIRVYMPKYKNLSFERSGDSSGNERHRQYIAPYFTYKLSDTVKIEGYYEHQINRNYEIGQANRGYFHYKRTRAQHTANLGISFPVNPSLSLYPFIRAYQLGTWDPETLGYGMWIMAALY